MKMICKLLLLFLFGALFQSLVAQNHLNQIAQFQGEHNRSGFGETIVSLDFNHDGYDDLIVLSLFYGYQYPSTPSRGKVYIYYGGPSFSSNTPAVVTLEGDYNLTSGRWITYLSCLGDINGDGFDDLVIGETYPQGEDVSKLLFFTSPSSSLDNPDYVLDITDYIEGPWFSRLGDVNGDGFDDIGLAYRPNVSNQYNFSLITGGDFTEHTVYSFTPTQRVINTVTNGIGDINNDGYADISIGYRTDVGVNNYYEATMYYGNAQLTFTEPHLIVHTNQFSAITGIPLGDMNGDGYDDFIGYIVDDVGFYAWLGGETLPDFSSPDICFTPELWSQDTARFTVHGDVNGDGFEDFTSAGYYGSRVGLWLGGQNVNSEVDWTIANLSYDNFGMGISMGDYNADGYCDIAIAAPYQNMFYPNGSDMGYIWVLGGSPTVVDTVGVHEDVLPKPVGMRLSVYPNPLTSNQNLTIEVTNLSNKAPLTVEVFNVKGQCLFRREEIPNTKDKHDITARTSDWGCGVYLCRVTQGKHCSIKKLSVYK